MIKCGFTILAVGDVRAAATIVLEEKFEIAGNKSGYKINF